MYNLSYKLFTKVMSSQDTARLKNDHDLPKNIFVARDINYAGKSGADDDVYQRLDVIYKEGTEGLLPVIFNIHGGGWIYGDKEVYHNYALRLAETGYAVVNINYRLAPQYNHPAQMLDCIKALEWTAANAQDYHIDLDNVFVIGDSAGASLASFMGVFAANDKMREHYGLSLPVKIRGLGLACGAYGFMETLSGKVIRIVGKKLMGMYFGVPIKKAPDVALYSTFRNMNADFPPTFLTSCKDDFLYTENVLMAKKLKELGIKNDVLIYENDRKVKKLEHVFHYRWVYQDGSPIEEAVEVRERMIDFFDSLRE